MEEAVADVRHAHQRVRLLLYEREKLEDKIRATQDERERNIARSALADVEETLAKAEETLAKAEVKLAKVEAKVEEKLAKAEAKVEETLAKAEVEKVKAKIEQVEGELRKTEAEVEKAKAEVEKVKAEAEKAKDEVEKAKAQEKQLERELAMMSPGKDSLKREKEKSLMEVKLEVTKAERDAAKIEAELYRAQNGAAKLVTELQRAEIAVAKVEANLADAEFDAVPLSNQLGREEKKAKADAARKFLENLLAKTADASNSTKRICLREGGTPGMVRFLYEIADYSRKGIPEPGGVMQFLDPWFGGGETSIQQLYVRSCYASMFQECEMRSTVGFEGAGKKGVAIIGTPGIGKSGFGIYSVACFARTRAVYFQYKTHEPYLIVGCTNALRDVRSVFNDVEKLGVYEFPRDWIRKKMETIPNLVAVVDPPRGVPVYAEKMFQLVVSSPDDVKLKEFLKTTNTTVRRVMPKWSLEEVLAIVPLHASKDLRSDSSKLEEFEATSREAFEFFGGVPRSIFDEQEKRPLVNAQIRIATLDALKGALCAGESVKGPLGAYLVHLIPMPDSPGGVKYEIASMAIGKLLVQKFVKDSHAALDTVFLGLTQIPEFQPFRGRLLESTACASLSVGGNFDLAELNDGSARPVFRKITLPTLEEVSFIHNNMSDLLNLNENQLAVPLVKNFPSLDAFTILRKSVLTGSKDDESQLLVVGFQVTVSDNHPINGVGLKRVRAKVDELRGSGGSLPITLVFVSTTTGINKRQRITKHDKEDYRDGFDDRVPQYVIRIGDAFEKHAAMWKF